METFPCSVTFCEVEEMLHMIMRLLKIQITLLQVPINTNIPSGVFSLLSRQYSHIPIALIKLQIKRDTEWIKLQTLQIFLTKLPLEKRTPQWLTSLVLTFLWGVLPNLESQNEWYLCAIAKGAQNSSGTAKYEVLSIRS